MAPARCADMSKKNRIEIIGPATEPTMDFLFGLLIQIQVVSFDGKWDKRTLADGELHHDASAI